MLVRYAVRDLVDGEWVYRSARYRYAFGSWSEAQLWENPKQAAKDALQHREPYSQFREPRPACTVVTINIPQPE